MRLVLQLIHVSDSHFSSRHDELQAQRASLPTRLFAHFGKGMMGHDDIAIDEFSDALSYVLAEQRLNGQKPNSKETSDVKGVSWIVCTGDLSTFGNKNGSVSSAANRFQAIAQDRGIRFSAIYGNHDVWDGVLPYNSSSQDLDAARTSLRDNVPTPSRTSVSFPGTFPLVPVGAGCGTNGGMSTNAVEISGQLRRHPNAKKIVVTALNTILHDRVSNTFAYGSVTHDRYWQSMPTNNQLDELMSRSDPSEMRIAITHHPVYYNNPPIIGLTLTNADEVASKLGTRVGVVGQFVGEPIATLVLSGHTHETFPAVNSLPAQLPQTSNTSHHPLGCGQLQLVAGTISQRPWHTTSNPTHEFVVLRFIEHDDGHLDVEREVWRRELPGPAGRFLPVDDGNGAGSRCSELHNNLVFRLYMIDRRTITRHARTCTG